MQRIQNLFRPLATLTLSLATALPVIAQNKTLTYDRSYGNTMGGGSIHTLGSMSFNTVTLNGATARTASTRATAMADVTLFEKRAEVIYFEGTAKAWDGRFDLMNQKQPFVPGKAGSTRLFLRLAGLVVFDQTAAATQQYTASFSKDVYKVEKTFLVGQVPVIVKATVRAGIDFGPRAYVDPATTSASVTGFVIPWGLGTASAGVGVSGASAGLEVRMTFLKTHAEAGIESSPTHVGGLMWIIMYPVDLVLNLYARLAIKTWRYEVFRHTAPAINLLQRSN